MKRIINADLYVATISDEKDSLVIKLKNDLIVEVFQYYDEDMECNVYGIRDATGAGTETCISTDLNDLIEFHWSVK